MAEIPYSHPFVFSFQEHRLEARAKLPVFINYTSLFSDFLLWEKQTVI